MNDYYTGLANRDKGKKPVKIIGTEEISAHDDAVASRIYEKTKDNYYVVSKDKSKNMRYAL